MTDLNRLELALLDDTGTQLDLYIEDATTSEIRRDIDDIKRKAALSTPAGELRQKILDVLEATK